jgi:NADPH-dependent 2,4-dienoyl-CoA reductase/sulfur reductase-like enzyme
MDTYRIVILGGGMVAGYAAKELSSLGLGRGELAIVSSDDALPYERPPLSKGYLAGKEEEQSVFINDEEFYRAHGFDVRLRTTAERLNAAARTLHLGGQGEGEVGFERLLVATGSAVRTFDLPGADLGGISYLRTLGDSRRIREHARAGMNAVVIGAGFIGMEVASVLAGLGLHVTMLFPEERVWQAFFTPEISAFFTRYYTDRGVTILPGQSLERFEGQGQVSGVRLKSGRTLPADMVVAGIGVRPSTEALEGSGIELDNGVVVNEYLETNVPGVLAAGDVANYRDVVFEKRRRVEHWDNAVEQGKHAARVLMGDRRPFVHVPYFFSDVFDLSYEFWGDTSEADGVQHHGDLSTSSFSAWWTKRDVLVAAFVMNRLDQEREQAPRLIEARAPLAPSLFATA